MASNVFFMRYFLFSTLVLLAFTCANDEESECGDLHKGDVTITSQIELNNFGRCNYSVIEGAIRLSGVTDLMPLENLAQVQSIYIFDTGLKNLNGLDNLNILAGRELNQYGNYKGPNEIGNYHEEGRIEIRRNNELHNLEGLSNLINIPIITVSNNVKLYDFCELSGDIEGNVHYVVEGNEFNPTRDQLRNQIQCKKLKNENCDQDFEEHLFTGNVEITNQQELIDFGTLNYSTIKGTLSITNVNDLNGLEGIRVVTNLKITDTNITNLDALQCLTDVNSIELKNNPFLENIKGLMYADISEPNVFDFDIIEFENESGSLIISNNNALTNLEGLSSITHLDLLSVKNNSNIVSMEGLNNLNEITGYYDAYEISGYTFIFIAISAFVIIYKCSFLIEQKSRLFGTFLIWAGKRSLNIFLVHPFLLAIVPYILIANFDIKDVLSRHEYLLLIYALVFLIVYLYEKLKIAIKNRVSLKGTS